VNQERGMIYTRMNQWQPAIQEFQKALQKYPQRTELIYNIGVSYYRMGDPKRAAEYLQKFLGTATPEFKAEQKTARQILAELRNS
jgi:tetratricopeptide (TPR) repeat protein